MKKGLKIFLIILSVLFLLLIFLALLLYFVIPIKIATLCISNEFIEIPTSCSSDDFCRDELKASDDFQGFPESLGSVIDDIFEKAVYCDSNCKIKEIQVISVIANQDIDGLEKVDSCNGEEIKIRITISKVIKTMKDLR